MILLSSVLTSSVDVWKIRLRCRLQCVNNVSTNVLWWRCKCYMMVSQDFYITFYHFCSCKIHQVPNVTLATSAISSACRPDFHIYLGDCRFTFCSRLLACARAHVSACACIRWRTLFRGTPLWTCSAPRGWTPGWKALLPIPAGNKTHTQH